MTALAQANEVRYAQARTKKYIASLPRVEGKALVAALLERPTEDVARMRVDVLLGAIKGFGSRSVVRTLFNANFVPSVVITRRVGPIDHELCLTERQRMALAEELLR